MLISYLGAHNNVMPGDFPKMSLTCPLMVLWMNSSSILSTVFEFFFIIMATLKIYCIGEGSHLSVDILEVKRISKYCLFR